ncbi:MAG: glycosyltransferase, partial [Planctomycetota bacterium]|nr:glycosyltransferase [Planctomycetota bacterium]
TYTLTVAELKERKGHHLGLAGWMRVAREMPELHHYVVGRMADHDYVRSLMIPIEEVGLADRVHFLGTVDEDEKIDLLQHATVFLHTPIVGSDGGFEGFGIVYLEAAACGRPAVGTLHCGAEDAIADGETGFLVEHDPGAVADALRRLLGDEALRERMGRAGRRRAEKMDWDGNAEEVLALYREALASGGTG